MGFFFRYFVIDEGMLLRDLEYGVGIMGGWGWKINLSLLLGWFLRVYRFGKVCESFSFLIIIIWIIYVWLIVIG